MMAAPQSLRPRCLTGSLPVNDNFARMPYAPAPIDGDLVDRVFRLRFWSRSRARLRAMLVARGILP